MPRVDLHVIIEFQNDILKTAVLDPRLFSEIGAPHLAHKERIAGKKMLPSQDTDGVLGVPGGVQDGQLLFAQRQPGVMGQRDARGRIRVPVRQGSGSGELPQPFVAVGVVMVAVGVQDVAHRQAVIDRRLIDPVGPVGRINQSGLPPFTISHHVGEIAITTRFYLFDDHLLPPCLPYTTM